MVENIIQIKVGIMIKLGEEKDYIWNAATCSCENAKHLKLLLTIPWLYVMKF